MFADFVDHESHGLGSIIPRPPCANNRCYTNSFDCFHSELFSSLVICRALRTSFVRAPRLTVPERLRFGVERHKLQGVSVMVTEVDTGPCVGDLFPLVEARMG